MAGALRGGDRTLGTRCRLPDASVVAIRSRFRGIVGASWKQSGKEQRRFRDAIRGNVSFCQRIVVERK